MGRDWEEEPQAVNRGTGDPLSWAVSGADRALEQGRPAPGPRVSSLTRWVSLGQGWGFCACSRGRRASNTAQFRNRENPMVRPLAAGEAAQCAVRDMSHHLSPVHYIEKLRAQN